MESGLEVEAQRPGVEEERDRRAEISRLLRATIEGSLSPLSRRELLATVDLVLEVSWTDVTRREVEAVLDSLSLDDIEIDGQGRYYAEHMPRTFDEALSFMAEVSACVSALEELEGSDCETLRSRQVSSLFDRPLLSAHEEQLLGCQVSVSTAARNELVVANLRLARSIAASWSGAVAPALDSDDLFQEACLGLVRAAEKFDPKLGYRFSTYASWWIRQAVSRALADKSTTIRRPVHIVERLIKLRRARRQQTMLLGRTPGDSELQVALAMPAPELDELKKVEALECVALDELTDEIERRLFEVHGIPVDEDAVTGDGGFGELAAFFFALDDRSRMLLSLRLGLDGSAPMTLDAIGAKFGLTRERVRQLERQALKRFASVAGLAA